MSPMLARVVVVMAAVCAIEAMAANVTEKPKSTVKCEEPSTHYLELGCKPVYSRRTGKCPERYECPFLSVEKNNAKCYYKSKAYDIGERLGENVIDQSCSVDCQCTGGFGEGAMLNCASVECPDLFEPYNPNKTQCIKQYKLKDCCSHNEICEPEKIKDMKTCEFNGKTYREGEIIYPPGVCQTCICSDKFDGTLKSLSCAKINCGIEIYNHHNVNKKCAPVYIESDSCCPIYWKCLEDEDEIVKTNKPRLTASTCKFGEKELRVGDEIVGNDKCVTCKCNVPPLVSCIRSKNC